MKYFIITAIVFYTVTCIIPVKAESILSPSLSRMEREWFSKEFNNEPDETRISRLEERVFGTIHDIDTKTRYNQLVKAFNAKKNMQLHSKKQSQNFLYGVPTSNPLMIDELMQGGRILY